MSAVEREAMLSLLRTCWHSDRVAPAEWPAEMVKALARVLDNYQPEGCEFYVEATRERLALRESVDRLADKVRARMAEASGEVKP